MNKAIFIGSFALVIALAGCAVGPDYHRPDALQNQPLLVHLGDVAGL